MDGHLVPASSNSDIRYFLENFTLDAERWLSALYWCVRTSMVTMRPMLRQTAGCESLENDSKAAAGALFVSNHRQAVY
jgi:hypothetical protein